MPTKKTLTRKMFPYPDVIMELLTLSPISYAAFQPRANAGYVKFQWNDMIQNQAYMIYAVFCDTIWAIEIRYIFVQSVQVSIQITYESRDIHWQNASVLLTFFLWYTEDNYFKWNISFTCGTVIEICFLLCQTYVHITNAITQQGLTAL